MKELATAKGKRAKAIALAVALTAVSTGVVCAGAAHADQKSDVFAAGNKQKAPERPYAKNPNPAPNAVAAKGAFAMDSNDSPELRWFEYMDSLIVRMRKKKRERIILSRPFNQELERVQAWTKTANEVAKRYKLLAMKLRRLDPPANRSDLKEYLDFTADWYSDVADVYIDLIKPRPPAKTMEELEAQLADVKSRAKALNKTIKHIHMMDKDLRGKYKVHKRTEDDPLQKYVTGIQHGGG